jgi:glycosyltransferase involved in cell wall biosynthesis
LNSGVSVIVCTYNGRARISKTIESILLQEATIPYELILVDNNSPDNTFTWLNEYFSNTEVGDKVKIVKEAKVGLSYARSKGIAKSRFSYLLFCDDDNWLSPGFIENGFKILSSNPAIGILGAFGRPVFEGVKPSWFDQYAHSYAVGSLGKKSGKQEQGSYHYGASCFFKKEGIIKLQEIGFTSLLSDRSGKSLTSGGDVELCLALQLLGYELHFDQELVFDHYLEKHRLNWSYYLNLKKGITSSFPLLESYKLQEFNSERLFKKHLLCLYWYALKGYLKSLFGNLLTFEKEKEVAMVVTKTKLKAFLINYHSTVRSFQRNLKIFHA